MIYLHSRHAGGAVSIGASQVYVCVPVCVCVLCVPGSAGRLHQHSYHTEGAASHGGSEV